MVNISMMVSVDGPHTRGIAKGTINGSPPGLSAKLVFPGKIIPSAIINRIIPPATLKDTTLILRSVITDFPKKRKNIIINKAIKSSLITTFLLFSSGTFLSVEIKTGMFPIGSITSVNVKTDDIK